MSRRLLSTALALAMAGGVYLSTGAGTAEASNMGFKLERSFSYVTGTRNLYLVAFPLFNGLGDVSDGLDCTATGDGVISVQDALCDLATSRENSVGVFAPLMTIQKYDETSCRFVGATILREGPGDYRFIGDFRDEDLTSAVNREIGYYVSVAKATGDLDEDIVNRAVIVGSHDPSWAGKMISRACPQTVLNLPYHTMYRTANEVLCGLEGVDWVDEVNNLSGAATPDGKPDSCPAGLFDPTSGVAVTTQTFDNATGFSGLSVFDTGGMYPSFVGTNFDLTPGDGYLFNMNTGYNDRLWLPPHF